jgi:hypothetical protein
LLLISSISNLQTINGLLEQQVLRLLVVEGAIRLLSQLKISSELINAVFENLLLLAGFVCLDGMESGRTSVFFDFRCLCDGGRVGIVLIRRTVLGTAFEGCGMTRENFREPSGV